MKYIYRLFEAPQEKNYALVLTWHDRAFKVGGHGAILRTMTDRKHVWRSSSESLLERHYIEDYFLFLFNRMRHSSKKKRESFHGMSSVVICQAGNRVWSHGSNARFLPLCLRFFCVFRGRFSRYDLFLKLKHLPPTAFHWFLPFGGSGSILSSILVCCLFLFTALFLCMTHHYLCYSISVDERFILWL